jgi:hypothetical protein
MSRLQMPQAEVLAAILASMPVPPLPQIVVRGEDSEDGFASSHDTIAASMIHVMLHANEKVHTARQSKQHELLRVYADIFKGIETSQDAGLYKNKDEFYTAIYTALCAYTRGILSVNDPQGRSPDDLDIRFEAHSSISSSKRGDSVFDMTYDHLSALVNVINHENSMQEISVDKIELPSATNITYNDMLQLYFVNAWI